MCSLGFSLSHLYSFIPSLSLFFSQLACVNKLSLNTSWPPVLLPHSNLANQSGCDIILFLRVFSRHSELEICARTIYMIMDNVKYIPLCLLPWGVCTGQFRKV